jgi:ecotropic viral integration site 5 protein
MCERGIPRSMRGPTWRLFCESDEVREVGAFDLLTTQTGEHDEQVDRDISRTFPRHVLFADANGHGFVCCVCVLSDVCLRERVCVCA